MNNSNTNNNSFEDEIDGINIIQYLNEHEIKNIVQYLNEHEIKIKRILIFILGNFVTSIFFPIVINVITAQIL